MKKSSLILAVSLVLFAGIAVARAGGMVEQSVIGTGMLIESIAYPDGGAVDVTLDDGRVRFAALVVGDSTVSETATVMLICKPDRFTVRANGRTVHLVTDGATCGIKHYRYSIPDSMRGLGAMHYSVFAPMVD